MEEKTTERTMRAWTDCSQSGGGQENKFKELTNISKLNVRTHQGQPLEVWRLRGWVTLKQEGFRRLMSVVFFHSQQKAPHVFHLLTLGKDSS